MKNSIKNSFIVYFISSLLFILGACASINGHNDSNDAPTNYTNIPRSQIDKTKQKFFTLDNGLHLLVIEDTDATQTIVALNVGVGGYRDPANAIGLSHFLEHATFMGSKNFPNPSGLFNFVTSNGGVINAITSDTGTTFFFRVDLPTFPQNVNNSTNIKNPQLEEGLNRLTDAIISPLLEDQSSLSELKNVQSEFVSNIHNFARQYNDAMAETVYNPKHPISNQPKGGNLSSLKTTTDQALMTELRDFHTKYYSANLMNAVIYSKLPINTTSAIASKYLNQIPNKNVVLSNINEKRIINKQKILHLQSEKKGKTIILTFEVPKLKNNFASFSYLDFLLKNLQANTAWDLLYKNNLITNISTNYEVTYLEPEDEFNIYIDLSEKGIKNQDLIVNTIFNYIDLIKEKGITSSYFKQLKNSLDTNFKNLKIDYSLDNIALLSSLMQELPPNKLYNYYLIPSSMKPKEVADTLNYITIANANITYASQAEPYTNVSKFFKAKYGIENFDIKRFSNANITQNFSKQLQLPPLNSYVANDFTINNPKSLNRSEPKLLPNPYGNLIYAMPSHFFKDNPDAYLTIDITNPFEYKQTKDYILPALTDLIFFKKYLGEFSKYDYANINWSYDFGQGQTLLLVGTPQYMLNLTQDFLGKFKTFSFDNQDVLDNAKAQLRLNVSEKRANMTALDNAVEILDAFSTNFIDDNTVLPIIQNVTLNDLNQYHQALLNNNKTKILSLGNLNDEQVLKFANAVDDIFPSTAKQYPVQYFPKLQSQKIAYQKQIDSESNAVVLAYYHPRYSYLENIIYARFLSYILSDSFFNELRTKKQLGYIIGASEFNLNRGRVLTFFIESPKVSPKNLYTNIQSYYQNALTQLKNMDDNQLNQFKISIDTNLTGVPQDIKDEFIEHNTDFLVNNTGKPIFSQLAEITRKMTKQDLINYFQDTVINEQGVVILSEIVNRNLKISSSTIVPKGFKLYPTLEELHRSLQFDKVENE